MTAFPPSLSPPAAAPDAAGTGSGPTATPLGALGADHPPASAVALHTFPTFLLSLLTALESDPGSVRSHLANLAATHAAPANFFPTAGGKPVETDAIIACASRIADRLQAAEGAPVPSPPSSNGAHASASGGVTASAVPSPSPGLGASAPPPGTNGDSAPSGQVSPSERRPAVPGETVDDVRRNCEDQIQALKVLHAEELRRAQLAHDSEVRSIAIVTSAIARGDLTKTIDAEVEGEMATLKETINDMVYKLRRFSSEVTRVSLDVGTMGQLGGQAVVTGVEGTWKTCAWLHLFRSHPRTSR